MRSPSLLTLLFFHAGAYGHHSRDHIEVPIDPSLTPPQGLDYLWSIIGPVAVIVVIGLIRLWGRYRGNR